MTLANRARFALNTPGMITFPRHPAIWLASGFGLGYAPVASGTVGAMLGVPLTWAIAQIPSVAVQLAVIVAIGLAGVPLCTAAARALGGKKDPGTIVFDEIASVPITFFLVRASQLTPENWQLWLTGFVLNRLFDVTKPPPARQLERLPAGLGIMADDWAAGVMSCLVLHAIRYWGWLN